MSILSSHAGSWHGDKWYRRAWYIWPQAISLLLVGGLFAGTLLKPIPWAQPQAPPAAPKPPPQPKEPERKTSPQTGSDEAICSHSNWANALSACSRLIDAGKTGFYYWRAQIYLKNKDYDRAIEDLSAFIGRNPNNVWALNDRGSSYEIKGDYDRAIADYSEVIRLAGKASPRWVWYTNRGSAYEKKGELDKALADFREALNNGNTTAS